MGTDSEVKQSILLLAKFLDQSENTSSFFENLSYNIENLTEYDRWHYELVSRYLKDGYKERWNPDYDECGECGAVHTPGVEKYLKDYLSPEETNLYQEYVNKFAEQYKNRGNFVKWRRPVPNMEYNNGKS